MRIAMVSEHASPLAVLGGVDAGGQNVHVAELAAALGRRGAEVVVHTRRDDTRRPREVPFARGVVVDHVDAGPPTELPKDELLPHMDAFARDLRERWAAEPPDVVHSHFWMSGLAATEAARDLGIPVVHTFHALGTVKRRHQGSADTSPPQRIAIERRLARGADRIVATCSDEVFELLRMGGDRRRVTVVPCGVDTGVFEATGRREARTPGVHRLVAACRLVERKGLGDVIAALADLPDTELHIAGGPDATALEADPEARRLRALAGDLGFAGRVHLRGRVDRDALPALLRSADAVVCAPWYEPFGIVPLEAMASGVPVVGAAVGGLLDSVVHGETGLLVPPRDIDALADALVRLLSDPALGARLGLQGRVRAVERYSWSTIAADTLAVYERVLQMTVAPAAVTTRGR